MYLPGGNIIQDRMLLLARLGVLCVLIDDALNTHSNFVSSNPWPCLSQASRDDKPPSIFNWG